MHKYKPGTLVEVVKTAELTKQFLGKRFVIREHGHDTFCGPSWQSPFTLNGTELVAEEEAIRPLSDPADFQRFMERVLKPVFIEDPHHA